jgi:hypothetical protein
MKVIETIVRRELAGLDLSRGLPFPSPDSRDPPGDAANR